MRPLNRSAAIALVLTAVFSPSSAWAAGPSPAGLWKSIDDASSKPRSLVRIVESNGTLQGKIEKVFLAPGEDPNPKCKKCGGALKGTPVIGLAILTGLKKNGDEYAGGQILDPDSGNVYRSKVKLIDSGKKLSVRGYIGAPMLGRSQIWERQE